MPEFTNPFPGVVPRQMTHGELVRAIMLNIAAELEAVHIYTAHMDATDNPDAKKVLHDVALEELVHAGEFTSLLYRLDPIAAQKAQEGFAEVEQLLSGTAPAGETGTEERPTDAMGITGPEAGQEIQTPQGLTVGNLVGMP